MLKKLKKKIALALAARWLGAKWMSVRTLRGRHVANWHMLVTDRSLAQCAGCLKRGHAERDDFTELRSLDWRLHGRIR